jgi:hypothetical protein
MGGVTGRWSLAVRGNQRAALLCFQVIDLFLKVRNCWRVSLGWKCGNEQKKA